MHGLSSKRVNSAMFMMALMTLMTAMVVEVGWCYSPPEVQFSLSGSNAKERKTPATSSASGEARATEQAPIFVIPSPNGLLIVSKDSAAADEFQRLFGMLADSSSLGGNNFTVFYLKHAKASSAAEMLNTIMVNGNAWASTAPLENNSEATSSGAFSSMPRYVATGLLKITVDNRLNALIVQANPVDVESINQLLAILDQRQSPVEISLRPKVRMIPVHNTDARELADVVQQVFADRMAEHRNRQMEAIGGLDLRGGPASPDGPEAAGGPQLPGGMLMAMMADGDDMPQANRGGGSASAQLSIAADPRTNSLVVSAPEAVFKEVRQLVESLDVTTAARNDTIKVVTLHGTNSNTVIQSVAAITGDRTLLARATPMMNETRSTIASTRMGQGGYEGFEQAGMPSPGTAQPQTATQGPMGGMSPGGMGEPAASRNPAVMGGSSSTTAGSTAMPSQRGGYPSAANGSPGMSPGRGGFMPGAGAPGRSAGGFGQPMMQGGMNSSGPGSSQSPLRAGGRAPHVLSASSKLK